jgi:hypothetical protein
MMINAITKENTQIFVILYISTDPLIFNYLLDYIVLILFILYLLLGHDNLSIFKTMLKCCYESKKQVCTPFSYFRG